MKYEILNKNYNKNLIDRLLEIRWISDKEKFLNPDFSNSWHDFELFADMKKSVEKVCQVMEKQGRIVIFGDYDVDGVTATYVLFYFFHKILKYEHVSLRLPSRADGYGIRGYHLDELKEKWVELVITVDNGITAVSEIEHARKIGLDVIITDHHSPLEKLPDAFSLVNPKTSPDYPFEDLSWVGVAFKFVCAISQKLNLDKQTKQKIMDYFLPIVAIGTVADCVGLVDENRLLVKKWLEIMNNPAKAPRNIKNMMEFLNLKTVESYHIGFVIWPRLNASWRIHKPDDSFQVLYQHNKKFQTQYLEKLENMNTTRRWTQSDILKEVEKEIDLTKNILVACGDFHEWVIGIVAGRITEKYNKPSIVMHVDKEKNQAVWSCRAPAYFNIVKMLETVGGNWLLERFGGHAQAGWLTCKLDNVDKFRKDVYKYWRKILPADLEKISFVDTKLTEKDLLESNLNQILDFAPFGEQNKEPVFLIENIKITKIDLVGKQQKHLKIYGQLWKVDIVLLRWSGVSNLDKIDDQWTISVVANIAKDDFKGWYYFKIKDFLF